MIVDVSSLLLNFFIIVFLISIFFKANANKLLRTEITLPRQEFLEYNARDYVDLTFCLKEMKAVLNFCENSGQPVTLFYDKPGKPILLVLHFFNVIEADFVLATLIDPSDDDEDTPMSSMDNVNMSSGQSSTPSSSFPSSSGQSSIAPSSIQSSIPSSMMFSKDDAYSVPGSLQDFKFNKPEPTDDMDLSASGHVSGSDDESVPPITNLLPSETRRKRPVFSTDFQNLNDDSDSDDPMQS